MRLGSPLRALAQEWLCWVAGTCGSSWPPPRWGRKRQRRLSRMIKQQESRLGSGICLDRVLVERVDERPVENGIE